MFFRSRVDGDVATQKQCGHVNREELVEHAETARSLADGCRVGVGSWGACRWWGICVRSPGRGGGLLEAAAAALIVTCSIARDALFEGNPEGGFQQRIVRG